MISKVFGAALLKGVALFLSVGGNQEIKIEESEVEMP